MNAIQRVVLMVAVGVAMTEVRGDLSLEYLNKGSDSEFRPAANVVVDLSMAATGSWDSVPAVPGSGVYDPEKWAVVFKYSSVDIPAGVTVTFKNHPSRAPVVWLVDGEVVIRGRVDLSGTPALPGRNSEGGPGGFRGGIGGSSGLRFDYGYGLGPGGGSPLIGGSFATAVVPNNVEDGGVRIAPYGSSSLVPLIGGSGGGGWADPPSWGGGGGGAILIVGKALFRLDGEIVAVGTSNGQRARPAGSGGAIRVVADALAGAGVLNAHGFGDEYSISGSGRIRLEAKSSQAIYNSVPETIVVPPVESEAIWGRSDLPVAQIVSVNGQAVAADPRGEWDTGASPDVTVQSSEDVQVLIRCRNLPTNSVVTLRSVVRRNPAAGATDVNRLIKAEFVSGDETESMWSASLGFVPGFRMLQVVARSQ